MRQYRLMYQFIYKSVVKLLLFICCYSSSNGITYSKFAAPNNCNLSKYCCFSYLFNKSFNSGRHSFSPSSFSFFVAVVAGAFHFLRPTPLAWQSKRYDDLWCAPQHVKNSMGWQPTKLQYTRHKMTIEMEFGNTPFLPWDIHPYEWNEWWAWHLIRCI